jgi:GNAT superfamily N-acetyltransferase
LIKELAAYEHASDQVQATEESLLATLSFSPAPERGYARTMLVFDNNEPAGMALYFYNYSTWTGRPGIFLEDLFVRPQFRRKGLGHRLLGELAGEVLRVQGARLDWNVLKWNEPSIKF